MSTYEDLDHPFDMLRCRALWTEVTPEQAQNFDVAGRWGSKYEYILPEKTGPQTLRFVKTIQAPMDGEALTLRSVFRWSTKGHTVWQRPQIRAVESVALRPPVRVAVVTGHMYGRQQQVLNTVQANVAYYANLCEQACRDHPNLIVLPEWCLQLQVPGHPLDKALPRQDRKPTFSLPLPASTKSALSCLFWSGMGMRFTTARCSSVRKA